jgi:MFS family permease
MIKAQSRSHIWIIWIITFFNGLIFYIPIFALYLQQQLLDFTEVALIMAFQSIFIIIFEIPSGAFADLFGRKKSLVIGASLNLLSLFFLYFGSNFFILTLFAITSALFQSLNSGTIEAIIYDTLKENDKDEMKNNHTGKKTTFKQFIAVNGAIWPISASIASLLGSLLSVHGYKITILVTFLPVIVRLLLILKIRDPTQINPDRKNILAQIKVSMKYIHIDKQIKLLLLSGFLVYSFAEVAFQMKPIYFSAIDLPIEYFGIIYTLSFAFSFLGSIFSERISLYFSYKTLLISAQVSIGLFFFAPSFIPFAFINATIMSIESFFWGLRWPIQIDWINSRINSKERATINSATNLMNNLGFTIFVILAGISLEIIDPIWLIRFIGIFQIFTIFLLFGLKNQIN